MASLSLLGAAAAGTAATISPKGTLAKTGLRTRSVEDVITGERIPGSASNKFLQLIGKEKKEDVEETINDAERKSAKKKGIIFVFNLLLKTFEDMKEIEKQFAVLYRTRNWARFLRHEQEALLKKAIKIKEKEYRLLYIIVYSSFLASDDASQDMRDLRTTIKHDFGLVRPDNTVRNWKDIDRSFNSPPYFTSGTPINRAYYAYHNRWKRNLDDKIAAVHNYISIATEKRDTQRRRLLDKSVKRAAKDRKPKYGLPQNSSIAPYENAAGVVGPYAHIGDYLPDTKKYKDEVIDKRKKRSAKRTKAAVKLQSLQRGRKTRSKIQKKTSKKRKGGKKKTRRKKKKRKTRKKSKKQ